MKGSRFSLAVAFSGLFLLSSCGLFKKDKVSNDLEDIKSWNLSHPTLTDEDAHSGKFSSKTDSINPYSIGFNKPLGDISKKPITKLKIKCWAKFKDADASADLVVGIDSAGQNTYRFAVPIRSLLKNVNQWSEFTATCELPKKTAADQKLILYVWNTGKKPIWIDDIEFDY
jgi:hypothetical protein